MSPRMGIEGMLDIVAIFGIPAIVLAASKAKFLPVKGNFKLAFISFVILYAYIVGSAWLAGYQIEQDLHTYDLDGNGSFSPNEMTPDAKAALDRFAHDTGRAFAPITGFIFSFIYVAVFYLVAYAVGKYVQKST